MFLSVLLDRYCCDHFSTTSQDLVHNCANNDLGWALFGVMAVQEENDFQLVIDRFEDDVLALAYYIKDRDVICGE